MSGSETRVAAYGVSEEWYSTVCDVPMEEALLHPILMFPVLWEEMLGDVISYYRMKGIALYQMFLIVRPEVFGKVLLHYESNRECTGIFY